MRPDHLLPLPCLSEPPVINSESVAGQVSYRLILPLLALDTCLGHKRVNSDSLAPFLFPFSDTHTDGIRFCSIFLSSSSTAAHLCRVFAVRVYGLTTPQETETPRRFRFRSIQRVYRLYLTSMDFDSLDSNRTTIFLPRRRPSPTNANIVPPLKPPRQQTLPQPPISILLRINERDSLPKRVQNPALPDTTSAVVRGIRNPFLVNPLVPSACPSLGTLTTLGSLLII